MYECKYVCMYVCMYVAILAQAILAQARAPPFPLALLPAAAGRALFAGAGVSAEMATAESVPEAQVLQVLLFLTPTDTARVQATCRTGAWGKTSTGSKPWVEHMTRAFGQVADCVGPFGQDCGGDWSRAFALWHGAAREAGLECVGEAGAAQVMARWVAVWCRLRRWLRAEAPEVERTLLPPADVGRTMAGGPRQWPEGLAAAAPEVTGLWGVCDGQTSWCDGQPTGNFPDFIQRLGRKAWWLGLFGGYSVYNQEVSTNLLPLSSAVHLTQLVRLNVEKFGDEHPSKLAFACSDLRKKILMVDVSSGAVYTLTSFRRTRSPLLEPACPEVVPDCLRNGALVSLRGLQSRPALNGQSGEVIGFDALKLLWQVKMLNGSGTNLIRRENLLAADGSPPPPSAKDGLLRWFEQLAARLEDGVYVTRPLRPEMAPETQGICLYPMQGPELSICTTRGVEVTASAIYTPQDPNEQGWTYSIAFRLRGTAEERGFETCQLSVRKWMIQDGDRAPEVVQGEGVIGLFPILADGGWILNDESDPHGQYQASPPASGLVAGEFRYQSCSGRNLSMRGSFGGELTFVPGTRKKPTGPPFQATLKPFALRVPEYIF